MKSITKPNRIFNGLLTLFLKNDWSIYQYKRLKKMVQHTLLQTKNKKACHNTKGGITKLLSIEFNRAGKKLNSRAH